MLTVSASRQLPADLPRRTASRTTPTRSRSTQGRAAPPDHPERDRRRRDERSVPPRVSRRQARRDGRPLSERLPRAEHLRPALPGRAARARPSAPGLDTSPSTARSSAARRRSRRGWTASSTTASSRSTSAGAGADTFDVQGTTKGSNDFAGTAVTNADDLNEGNDRAYLSSNADLDGTSGRPPTSSPATSTTSSGRSTSISATAAIASS